VVSLEVVGLTRLRGWACAQRAYGVTVETVDFIRQDYEWEVAGLTGLLDEADKASSRRILDEGPRQQRDYLLAIVIDVASRPAWRSRD